MAYARHGIHGGRPNHLDWLAALEWIDAGDQEVRVPLSHNFNLGPSWRAIRGAAVYLRNACFFASCLAHRGAIGHRDGCLSDRARATMDPAAAYFANRNAGGDPECDPWIMGNFCHDPMAPRLSGSVAQAFSGLDPVFQRDDVRPQYARGRNYHRHNDSTDHYFGFARDFAKCPGFTT